MLTLAKRTSVPLVVVVPGNRVDMNFQSVIGLALPQHLDTKRPARSREYAEFEDQQDAISVSPAACRSLPTKSTGN